MDTHATEAEPMSATTLVAPAIAAGPVRASRSRAWLVFLLGGVVLTGVYSVVPRLVADLLYYALGLSAAAAIAIGVRWHRPCRQLPWVLLGVGLLTLVVGDMVFGFYEHVLRVATPYPSAADAVYLLSYPVMAAGILFLVRGRTPEGDIAGLVDAGIIAVSAGTLSWIFLMEPYARDASLTLAERLVSVAYPLVDVLMIAAAARLAFAPGGRPRALYFLGGGLLALLVADSWYGLLSLEGIYQFGHPVDAGWLLFYIAWGAAALHPSMRRLAEPAGERSDDLTTGRFIILAVAALLAPAALVVQSARGYRVDTTAIVAGWVLLVVLAMARLHGVVRGLETTSAGLHEAARREGTLRVTAAALAAATEREHVHAAALAAAVRLGGVLATAQVATRVAAGEPFAVIGAVGPRAVRTEGASISAAAVPAPIWTELSTRRAIGLARSDAPALWDALGLGAETDACFLVLLDEAEEQAALLVVATAGPPSPDLRQALETLAFQAASALRRTVLAEELRQHRGEVRFRALVRHTADVIAITDADGTFHYVSPAAERVLGRAPEDLVGTDLAALVLPEDGARWAGFCAAVLARPGTVPTAEFRVHHPDGSWRHTEVVGSNQLVEPDVAGIVLTMRDITERKEAVELLAHQAFHDVLTGLPNRALFFDRLQHALARSARRPDEVAVLFVDLDRFKIANDSVGHETGDLLLVAVAKRLQAAARPSDTLARFGGDEFTVLLDEIVDAEEAVGVAARLLSRLEAPFLINEQEFFVSASIGIAVSTPEMVHASDLVRDADLAMYRSKSKASGGFELYDAAMGLDAAGRVELEAALRRAVERGELLVHYQPKVDLTTGRIAGLEALVRWEHPTRGLVPPTDFIPLAEDTGLILPIGRWVLEEACRQAARWQAMYPADPPTVSVNLSVRQFQHPTVVEGVAQVLRETGLPPSCLVLEITESVVMEDAERNGATLRRLHELGVTLALDDFGAGYSSLSYLKQLPVGMLKIDRSFISGLGRGPEDGAIVQAISTLAHTLNMEVTAEGVETADQLARLRELGCDIGQGYYFSRPVPSAEIDALLARFPRGTDGSAAVWRAAS